MMPEGLEKDLSPQDLADVIAYVRSQTAAPKTTQRANEDGVFVLLPPSAARFGPTLVIEPKYTNFGHWSSADDHVIWTVRAPKPGIYDVWIYYACANDSAGSTLAVQAGKERVTHEVDGTGTWDDYRGFKVGALSLAAGDQQIIVRSAGKIRRVLADLKKMELSPR